MLAHSQPDSPASGVAAALLAPEQHVLSTLERDGSRRWLRPRLNRGRWWRARRVVAYALIAVFTLIPFLRIGGKPLVLLDLPARRFTILGYTFLPTDTVLLALFLVAVLVSIFLLTALFGRVWCGWACPQTVYLEFVFRPIERLLEGSIRRGGTSPKQPSVWRVTVKYVLYFLVSLHLANTFLAYFVGVDRLAEWTTKSPLQHPMPFLIVATVTGLMMFDFCYFREQMCIIACPYGRFQSVLLDQSSLVVSYDRARGEPRGKKSKRLRASELPVVGDCIDCRRCVTTCPTGIDIRDGLQMECINCTQCIDACDDVMTRIGRRTGLIRYSSQARDSQAAQSFVRARTVIYPALLAVAIGLFVLVLVNQHRFHAVVLREPGNLHSITETGLVQNLLRLKITNRSDESARYEVRLAEPAEGELHLTEGDVSLEPFQTQTFHIQVFCPGEKFRNGRSQATIDIAGPKGDRQAIDLILIGPYTVPGAAETTENTNESDNGQRRSVQ